ncbi:hypothetical protein GCM10010319_60520 [Streptomyces blastmyceticus]|uniref:DUF6596 domain-containing protein n=1 Tax=Streptomyces blastmyceticus TaxID=68180 RepID=A0ABP3HNC5_9ACTN
MRAKRSLAKAEVPFEVPGADELSARLSSVLEVIYLVFNEGYAATAGDDWGHLPCRRFGGAAGAATRRCGWAGCWPG